MLERKAAVPLVEEEQRPGAADHKQILAALVLKVGEQRAGSIVQHADSGFFRHIFKCSVTAVAIEPVGQSGWLAYIKIVEAVVIEVPNCHSIVAIDVDADCAVKNGSPVIGAAKQLLLIGLAPPRACDVTSTKTGPLEMQTVSWLASHLRAFHPCEHRVTTQCAKPRRASSQRSSSWRATMS